MISIHLMLMLIENPWDFTLRGTYFNTSHVNVNLSFIRYSINRVYISIHLMLMLIPGCIVQISCNKAISIHLMLMLIQTIQGGMSGYSLISIHLMLMLIFVLNGCLHTADTISIHLMLMLIGNHSHSFQMSLFDFNTSHVNVNL